MKQAKPNSILLEELLVKYIGIGKSIKKLDQRIREAQPAQPFRFKKETPEDVDSTHGGTGYSKVGSSGENLEDLMRQREEHLQEYVEVGNQMFYLTLEEWLNYKRKSYANGDVFFYESVDEPAVLQKPIITLGDLIKHTSSHGICGKRFHFLNSAIQTKYGYSLTDPERFDVSTDLFDLLKRDEIVALMNDEEFAEIWLVHEKNEGGKWESYSKNASPT